MLVGREERRYGNGGIAETLFARDGHIAKAFKERKGNQLNAKYLTGAYPEGNAIFDLFIHPIDTLIYLFGKAQIVGMERKGGTIMLILRHENASGVVELSTDYTWTAATESLTVNTAKGTYETSQMETLTFRPKSGTILGIPKEKIFAQHPITIDLLHRNNFVPLVANNQVYTQGYFGEIKSFVNAVEGKGNGIKSSLEQLKETYGIMEAINNYPFHE